MVTMYSTTLEEALSALAETSAAPVAGGTDWMVRHDPADAPVFLGRIDALRAVRQDGTDISIGACCTFAQLLSEPLVPQLLKDAIHDIASPAIRNRGTIGGNIINASPAGDTLPPLYLLEATLTLQSQSGTRHVPVDTFILGVKRTDIRPGELLTRITLPATRGVTRFEKVGARRAQAISKCSFAGLLRIEDDIVDDFRAAFGAVGTTALRNIDAERTLVGLPAGQVIDAIPALRAAYGALLSPIDDQRSTSAYRHATCLNLLEAFIRDTLR